MRNRCAGNSTLSKGNMTRDCVVTHKFNKAVLNKVEPKKRPRSAMSPT
mgnify:CR=1 FL=1|jgi:gamma-glutamyltranspeptidase